MTAKKSSQRLADLPRVDGDTRRSHAAGDDELGRALRMVYDQTLDEHIPDAMLDLLKKLG
ncbi:MAG: Anti-sigma factor NepR [Pseudomonadota bacterium]